MLCLFVEQNGPPVILIFKQVPHSHFLEHPDDKAALRSSSQAQRISRTPGMYVRQPPTPDPACPTTDGYFGKLTSINVTTISWEGKQELFPPSFNS